MSDKFNSVQDYFNDRRNKELAKRPYEDHKMWFLGQWKYLNATSKTMSFLKKSRSGLNKARAAGNAALRVLDTVRSFVKTIQKFFDIFTNDIIGTLAKNLAQFLRKYINGIEATGLYMLPIYNYQPVRDEGFIKFQGAWFMDQDKDDTVETETEEERTKRQAAMDALVFMLKLPTNENGNVKEYEIAPQTFSEFKMWLGKKFSEKQHGWLLGSETYKRLEELGDRDQLAQNFDDLVFMNSNIGAPWTPFGKVNAYIYVMAFPNIFEFVDFAKALENLFGETFSNLFNITTMELKGSLTFADKPDNHIMNYNPPCWIGTNLGYILGFALKPIHDLIDKLESLSFETDTSSILQAILDIIDGIEAYILQIIKIIDLIDTFLNLIQKLLTMPGVMYWHIKSDINTATLIDKIYKLDNPWGKKHQEKIQNEINSIRKQYIKIYFNIDNDIDRLSNDNNVLYISKDVNNLGINKLTDEVSSLEDIISTLESQKINDLKTYQDNLNSVNQQIENKNNELIPLREQLENETDPVIIGQLENEINIIKGDINTLEEQIPQLEFSITSITSNYNQKIQLKQNEIDNKQKLINDKFNLIDSNNDRITDLIQKKYEHQREEAKELNEIQASSSLVDTVEGINVTPTTTQFGEQYLNPPNKSYQSMYEQNKMYYFGVAFATVQPADMKEQLIYTEAYGREQKNIVMNPINSLNDSMERLIDQLDEE